MESVQEYRLRLRLIRRHMDVAYFADILQKQQRETKKLARLLERLIIVMEKEHGITHKT